MATAGRSVRATPLPRTPWTVEQTHLLAQWGKIAAAAQHAHYLLATRLGRRNRWLGIPTVICSAIVGTSLFATLSKRTEDVPVSLRVLIGLLSVVAAVLAATQTFLRFAERSERHVQAGDWYSAIKRDVEQILAFPPEDRDDAKEVLNRIRKDMNKAGQTYPEIGERTWHNVAKAYGVEQPAFGTEVEP